MTRVAMRACGVLILALAFGVLVGPQASPTAYDRPVATVVALALVGIAFVIPRTPRHLPSLVGRILGSWWWVAAWVLLAAVSAYASIYPTDTWDPGTIRLLAASGREQWGQAPLAYAERYPNNLAVVAVGRALHYAAARDYAVAFALANVASFAVTAIAVRQILGRVSAAVGGVAVAVVGVLVGLSPWLSVAYVDAVSLWGPILGVQLALRADKARGRVAVHALWLGAGLACAAGMLLRTTPALAAAGIAVWLLVGLFRRADWRRTVAALLVFGVTFGGSVLGGRAALTALTDYPNAPATAMSPLVHVAMGLTYHSAGPGASYGSYDDALDKATYNKPVEVQNRVASRFIDARMTELGPVGLADFLARKNLFTWGDGSFFAFGEGGDGRTQPVQRIAPFDAFNAAGGPWRYGWTSVLNGIWLAVLLLLGWGLVTAAPRRDALLLALVVVALIVFLTGFQTRSRYVYTFVPVVVAAAGLVLPRRPSETDAVASGSVPADDRRAASDITVRDMDIEEAIRSGRM